MNHCSDAHSFFLLCFYSLPFHHLFRNKAHRMKHDCTRDGMEPAPGPSGLDQRSIYASANPCLQPRARGQQELEQGGTFPTAVLPVPRDFSNTELGITFGPHSKLLGLTLPHVLRRSQLTPLTCLVASVYNQMEGLQVYILYILSM